MGAEQRPASLARAVFTTTITVVAVVIGLYLVYLLRKPIGWLLIATFVAVALSGPVALLQKRMKRGFAITLTLIGVLLVPVGVLAIIVPPLVKEGSKLVESVPDYAREFTQYVNDNEKLQRINEEYDVTRKVQDWANDLPSRIGDAAQLLGDLGVGIVNSVFAAVTIFIMVAFILGSGPRWIRALLALQPPDRARRIGRTLEQMGQAVGAYVAGALFQALIAGITTFIVLTILGIPFAAPLAVLTALFDLIPMVGATLGAIVVGIVTVFSDFPVDTIIWVVWAIVYQQVENNLVQPRIQNRAVGIHPFGVIFAVLCGGTLLGIPGALLAVPVAASLQIAAKDWWDWRMERKSGLALPPGVAAAGPESPPPAAT
ncbi:AI-2E family transporter [Conexibacter sp. CPCC 206217]|uniref:AI-2E family transporter n=1 Tax=Conexibacter sp. CPCC 206217 TaxID=3064574 RepID=UPI002721FE26|nr:AI-2E family transporter [Conexibacter sp. CPCC 206217]MDO8209306.1 AI-2E family transporter [Conexibacter sp. CPCC 206217]